jgi:Ca2+-binding EF-hand superfamily protein
MVKLLTSNDWAFREKEIENFLRIAKHPETGDIVYEDYIEEMHNF